MNKKFQIALIAVGVFVILAGLGFWITYGSFFGSPQKQAESERFIVSLNEKTQDTIKKLHEQGFIKNEWAFGYALKGKDIEPGGYKISKSMNAWEMATAFNESYMKWVVIPEGLRKEQIADLIADALDWRDEQKQEWIDKYTAMNYDETEGVYFPDTYLLPKDETGLQIADRLRVKFNEKFQPYADKFVKENVKWTTALKVASLVQREAANKADMPLIAGIIWNRLLNDPPMKLEIDATVQYALGEPGSWWPKIKSSDYKTDSSYNTYIHTGLPPHPICNPGLDAIDAVLNPTETDCLYYLHDLNGQTHRAKTYEEHQANIEKYLKAAGTPETQKVKDNDLIISAIRKDSGASSELLADSCVSSIMQETEDLILVYVDWNCGDVGGGTRAILKKQGSQYKFIAMFQDPPSCDLMEEFSVPKLFYEICY